MTLHRGKLTARYVETAAPGTHDDGRGLRLIVRPSGDALTESRHARLMFDSSVTSWSSKTM